MPLITPVQNWNEWRWVGNKIRRGRKSCRIPLPVPGKGLGLSVQRIQVGRVPEDETVSQGRRHILHAHPYVLFSPYNPHQGPARRSHHPASGTILSLPCGASLEPSLPRQQHVFLAQFGWQHSGRFASAQINALVLKLSMHQNCPGKLKTKY